MRLFIKILQSGLQRVYAATTLLAVGLCLLLSACGGSGGDSNSPDNGQVSTLNVNIGNTGQDLGQNIIVFKGVEEIELTSHVRNEKGALNYIWQAANTSSNVNVDDLLSETNTANVILELPTDIEQNVSYTIRLWVTDSGDTPASTTITVTLKVPNTAPNITKFDLGDGVKSATYQSGEGFNLFAEWFDAENLIAVQSAVITVSPNPNEKITGLPTNGVITEFPTTQLSTNDLPIQYPISNGQFINNSDTTARLNFTLTITDSVGEIDVETIFVDILPSRLLPLQVDLGADQTVFIGQQVTIISQVSRINDIQYLWQQVDDKERLVLDEINNQIVTFTAPNVTETSIYTIQLIATDLINDITPSDTINITVKPIDIFDGINDTGITECATDDVNQAACGQSNLPNQDAEIGRDPASNNANLDKTGGGELGFDLTKIDENGDETFESADVPFCVKDNVTGLIWEIKTQADVRSHTHTFNWYSEADNNGGVSGVQDSVVASCFTNTAFGSSCDTQSYINYVNSIELCAGKNWRLPTTFELLSILNYGNIDGKLPLGENNQVYWRNHAKSNIHYWSSESALFGVSDQTAPQATRAWGVNLSDGDDASYSKNTAGAVLLVRKALPEEAE